MKKDYIKLELNQILKLLAEQSYSRHCREAILNSEPLNDYGKINREMGKTADAFRLSAKFGTPRFSDVKDPGESLIRAVQGGSLSLRELLDIAGLLRQISILASWYKSTSETDNNLSYLFNGLIPNKELLERIDAVIVSEDEIADNASPELAQIRRNINKQSLLIRERLEKVVRNSDTKKFLQEGIITQRDGRFVIPVKTENKNEIPGLVHDTSGSGATVFVEPMGVVEANNEIRLLKSREKDEIERIIAELSAQCGGFSDELNEGFILGAKLEVCFSKANLGAMMKGIVPEIVEQPILDLRKARHPLINPAKVVPISMTVGIDYNALIITGPNTGGKTVAVKTAGLLTLMARCGLMLPAAAGTQIGMFDEIYADIGDEQSIEQSLSTFSSHMTNIVGILNETSELGSRNLVLLDELGSGTDPSEGGALAVAILDELKRKGCLVIATTHYQEVKMYAIETDGVQNASCEFDIVSLRPTYKLVIGAPGKSNALAIAKRLGLGDGIINRADKLVSSEDKRFDNIIAALEESRRETDVLKEQIAQNERQSRELAAALENEKQALASFREKEMDTARQRALSIIESVRHSSELILDELEDLKRDKDKSDFSERVRGMRSQVNSALNKLHDEANPIDRSAVNKPIKPSRPLKLYDTVLLADTKKTGTVVSAPDSKGNCFVQIGVVKTKTNVSSLQLIEKNKQEAITLNGEKLSSVAVTRSAKTASSSASLCLNSRNSRNGRANMLECDIRGMASDEGVGCVAMFIDDSIMNHIQTFTVIHGKGTGILRKAVHDFLIRHKQVKEFRLGKYGEGEDGVTIVTLK